MYITYYNEKGKHRYSRLSVITEIVIFFLSKLSTFETSTPKHS